VAARALGASSVDFLVQWWAPTTPRDMRLTRSEVVIAVKNALDGAGIEMPYPYVTNTYKDAVPVRLQEAQAQDG
jgi:small conductance mechanosensitive channel